MEEYSIERLSEENFPKFHRLFCEVFDSNTSFDFLYKKYDTSYLGDEYRYLGFLAINKTGEAVSYYGAIPVVFLIQGKRYMTAQSSDSMTREDARKKGLFVQLLHKTNELCRQLGVAFIFGFPNQHSHAIFIKYAQWVMIGTTQFFEISVNSLPIATVIERIGVLKKPYQAYIKKKIQAQKSDTFIERKPWNGILRDRAFYDYKTYTPNHTIQFDHGKVWLKVKAAIFIGDVFIEKASDFSNLMAELKNFARQIGVRKIIFLASSSLMITQWFAEHYTAKQGNDIGVKLLQENWNLDIHQLQFTLGDYDTF